MRRPTIRDVASRAGVSIGTVSNVVTGRRSVGAAARSRVEAAIADLGYRPDPAGRALIARRQRALPPPNPRTPRLTCVGYVCADFLARVEVLPHRDDRSMAHAIERSLGGRAANVAVTAAGLGPPLDVAVQILSRMGWDAESDWAADLLHERGVVLHPLSRSRGRQLSRCLILVEASGHRTIVNEPLQVTPAAFRAWLDEQQPGRAPHALYVQGDQLHGLDGVLDAARCRGLDLVTHLVADDVRRLGEARLQDLGRRCGLLVFDAAAARLLVGPGGGRARLEAGLAELFATSEATLALTLGAEGAVLLRRGGIVARAAAPAVNPVDTTGAGDTFTGCLIAARLHGEPDADALAMAVVGASRSVSFVGAQSHGLTAAAIAS
ncbi:MAG: PfkB family carbohydrate kinase [Pseudomonadota bacterium]